MYIFCNNYSEKLSEFHIHDDLYINTTGTSRRPVNRPSVFLKSQTAHKLYTNSAVHYKSMRKNKTSSAYIV